MLNASGLLAFSACSAFSLRQSAVLKETIKLTTLSGATVKQDYGPYSQACRALQAHWYAVIANSEFMLHDVQNESFAEQLRERRRMFGEKNMPIDFFLVPEPEWLDRNFPAEGRRVGRPSLALVSPDKTWIT